MGFAWLVLVLVPQVQLEWRAPAECPQLEDVRARVDRSMARDAAGTIAARGEVVATGDRERPWALRLRLAASSGTAERELDGRSCEALADAAALMIAMAASGGGAASSIEVPEPEAPPPAVVPPIEPPALDAAEPQVSTPTATVETRSADVVTPRSSSPEAARRTTTRIAVELGVGGGFDGLAVPGIGGAVSGFVGLHWPRLRVRAFVLHAVVREVGDTPSARHRMTSGGLAACGFGNVGRWALGACGHVEAGRLRAEGRGGAALVDRGLPWLAVGGGPALQWRFADRWALTGGADVVVPMLRHTFSVGATRVGSIGPAGVRVLAGVAVRLP